MFGSVIIYFVILALLYLTVLTVSILVLGKTALLKEETIAKIGSHYVGDEIDMDNVKGKTFYLFKRNISVPLVLFGVGLLIHLLLGQLEILRAIASVVLATVVLGKVALEAGFLGYTLLVMRKFEIPRGERIVSMLPHGVIEYTGMLTLLGSSLLLAFSRGDITYVSIVVVNIAAIVLLFAAAYIEATVTPKLISAIQRT